MPLLYLESLSLVASVNATGGSARTRPDTLAVLVHWRRRGSCERKVSGTNTAGL